VVTKPIKDCLHSSEFEAKRGEYEEVKLDRLRQTLLTGQLSGLYMAFVLREFAITFRIHTDKNKINMSTKTAFLGH